MYLSSLTPWLDLYTEIKGNNGENCPVVCDNDLIGGPCPKGQTLCPSQTDSNNCPLPGQCVETKFDIDGNPCAPPQVCPVDCLPDEKFCSGGVLDNGCPRGDQCIPIPSGSDCEPTCPEPSCPHPPSKACFGGIDPETKCPLDPYCIAPKFGEDGEACLPYCPAPCPPGVQSCPGPKDPNGCQISPDTCAPGRFFSSVPNDAFTSVYLICATHIFSYTLA